MFEDYGDNDNSIYFRYHGFVPSINPFDCAKLALPGIPDSRKHAPLRRRLARAFQLYPDAFCVSEQRGIPNEVFQYLRILRMSFSELNNCAQALKNGASALQECFPNLPSQEDHSKLMKRIKIQLSKYPTTAAQDETILETEGKPKAHPLTLTLLTLHDVKISMLTSD